MECPAIYFQEKICNYFSKEEQNLKQNHKAIAKVIKLHNENLKNIGDVSFPAKSDIWHKYCKSENIAINISAIELLCANEGANVHKVIEDFLNIASKWYYPVAYAKLSNERFHLFLDRKLVFGMLIKQVLDKGKAFGTLRKDPTRLLRILKNNTSNDNADLSKYRSMLITCFLKNILVYSEWTLADSSSQQNTLNIIVQSVAEQEPNDEQVCSGSKVIKCGLVIDPKTKQKTSISTQDYQKLRSNELHLMALHKYGIRIKEDEFFRESMIRVGQAAVKVDLLEVKHTSPVRTILDGQGSTKGASFILYNSARLESLLRTFDEQVKSAIYTKLPEIDKVDFSLLNEEQEWQLLFGYILDFPNLIDRSLRQLEQGIISAHFIIRYIASFVSVFSCYYRRTRIMIDSREHLMPIVFARVYLIKAVRQVVNNVLALLDIDPVSFM